VATCTPSKIIFETDEPDPIQPVPGAHELNGGSERSKVGPCVFCKRAAVVDVFVRWAGNLDRDPTSSPAVSECETSSPCKQNPSPARRGLVILVEPTEKHESRGLTEVAGACSASPPLSHCPPLLRSQIPRTVDPVPQLRRTSSSRPSTGAKTGGERRMRKSQGSSNTERASISISIPGRIA
jgi:hypothetical protein